MKPEYAYLAAPRALPSLSVPMPCVRASPDIPQKPDADARDAAVCLRSSQLARGLVSHDAFGASQGIVPV